MQNLVALAFSPEELAEIDGALATLKVRFRDFIVLQPEERHDMKKLGPKSAEFVDQTFTVLTNNPQIVPPNLGLDEAKADKLALDQLRPRLQLLSQLAEMANDTEMALGSDVMACALEGYRLLGVSGKSEALKSARKELSARFYRAPRKGANDASDAG